jgi:DNA-binding response OmpR family regulator
MAETVLVVDDEPNIRDVLTYNLAKSGFRVVTARDGHEALALARSSKPDLIILDLMLPGIDGLDVCRALRKDSQVPIIMLTARDGEIDRVVGLELGADDYVVKPFSVRELTARAKSVLRRARSGSEPLHAAARVGDLVLDPDRHEVRWQEILIPLTSLEFTLLGTLMRHRGQVLDREQLLEQVWGYSFPGDVRTVDTAIRRLRARLREAAPEAAAMLVTVRGVGYKVAEE